jgi:NADPH:quinone reductase-like Zn-dependent oxidoreductase
VSRTVVGVGTAVTSFAAGDNVFGVTNARFTGGYAQYAVAAAADMLAIKPKSLSAIEAASVPVIAATAEQMLFDHAQLRGGNTVLCMVARAMSAPTRSNARTTLASA